METSDTESEGEVSVYASPFQIIEPNYHYDEVMNYIQHSLTCGICHGLVSNPMCCKFCASLFCEECIDQLDEYFERLNNTQEEPVQPICPYCRAPPTFEKTIYVRKILGYVFITCYNCNQKIRNSDLSHHLDSCVGKITNCILCGTKDKRERVHNCLYTHCPHCSIPILKEYTESHKEVCPEIEVQCPYCHILKKRSFMFDHHRLWCPEFVLNCEYCNIPVPRKDYNTHANSCPLARDTCEICDKSYPRNTVHLCPCTICEKCRTVIQKPRQQEHLENHCPNIELSCKRCNETFRRCDFNDHYCIDDEKRAENMVKNLTDS